MAIRTRKSEANFINENIAIEKETQRKDKRNYKTLTIPFNKTEYDLLITLADKYEQSLNGVIRYSLKKLSEN